MKMKLSALLLSALIVLSGCQTIQNASNKAKIGTLGGGSGAAIGAIIGAIAGGGKGAAIGAAIGGVVGGGAGVLIGHKMDKAKKAAEMANAEAEIIKDQNTGISYVKVTFPSGLLFTSGSHALSAQAKTDLATFAKNLDSDMDLYIYGHTDNSPFRGMTAAQSHAKNQELSLSRANSVSSYLQQSGLSAGQVKEIKGYGEDNPIADNATAAGKEQNRRVEVYILPSKQMIENANKASAK